MQDQFGRDKQSIGPVREICGTRVTFLTIDDDGVPLESTENQQDDLRIDPTR